MFTEKQFNILLGIIIAIFWVFTGTWDQIFSFLGWALVLIAALLVLAYEGMTAVLAYEGMTAEWALNVLTLIGLLTAVLGTPVAIFAAYVWFSTPSALPMRDDRRTGR